MGIAGTKSTSGGLNVVIIHLRNLPRIDIIDPCIVNPKRAGFYK
jgi:hypothetical protein